MSDKDIIKLDGTIVESLPNARFKVKLENDHVIDAHISGKMRSFNIKIILGDKVLVNISPYDMTRGRITYRYKNNEESRATTQFNS